jgi:hypothetical protein
MHLRPDEHSGKPEQEPGGWGRSVHALLPFKLYVVSNFLDP